MTVDDAVVFTARLGSGALGSFEATRCATGRKNGLRLELNGSAGSLAFDLERLNELEFFDAGHGSTDNGFRRVLVTEPGHPYLSGWWPPGHTLGLGAHVSPTRHGTCSRRSRTAPSRGRRSATGWRCSGSWTRSSAARHPAAGGSQ